MRGYLLDTNILTYWWEEGRSEHAAVCEHIAVLPDEAPLWTSAVVLGEIAYGCIVAKERRQAALRQFREFVGKQVPQVLAVRKSTAEAYGSVRARLFERFAPRNERKGLRPEQLVDPVTSKKLEIQENDLWIAAQAIEWNIVLVTNDRMRRIREVAPELEIENWTSAVGPWDGGADARHV